MSGNNVNLPQSILVFSLLVPLAILLGYLLAGPTDYGTVAFFMGMIALLSFPILIKHYHFLLILFMNSAFVLAILPGQPSAGLVLSLIGVFIVVLNRTMLKKTGNISVASVSYPLIFLCLVVAVTAYLTGGIGGQAFGGGMWGGKRYIMLFGAVFSYFALTSQRIPREKVKLYTTLFFLSGVTIVVSDLIYYAGPKFYGLYYLFPSQMASLQATTQGTLDRLSGVAWGAVAVFFTMLLRCGIRGLFDLSKPWRLAFTLAAVISSTLGGFRSALIVISIVFFVQFFMEKLHRTIFLPIVGMGMVLTLSFVIVFVDQMPLSVQRSLSFLPIAVDSSAKADAEGTLDWRFQMWRILLPDIPKYLLVGKGFSFSGTDLMLAQESQKRGLAQAYEETLVSGNYHSGILTTIIPFGIFGMLGLLWFCFAAFRVLWNNYRYGDPEFKDVNTFLFAYYISRLFFFLVFYGQLDMDLVIFTGTVALSMCVNGGVASMKAPEAFVNAKASEQAAPQPAVARYFA